MVLRAQIIKKAIRCSRSEVKAIKATDLHKYVENVVDCRAANILSPSKKKDKNDWFDDDYKLVTEQRKLHSGKHINL